MMVDQDRRFCCIGQAGNGYELLALVERQRPDAVLLDYTMPKMDGLETLHQLQERYAAVPVIMLTWQHHIYSLNSFIDAGAGAVLLKSETNVTEIRDALKSVLETGYYFNAQLSKEILVAILNVAKRRSKASSFQKLNEREIEVLRYTCDGLFADEIGRRMHLSARTVERIRVALLRKTGAKTPINLVVFAMQAGLYPVSR